MKTHCVVKDGAVDSSLLGVEFNSHRLCVLFCLRLLKNLQSVQLNEVK